VRFVILRPEATRHDNFSKDTTACGEEHLHFFRYTFIIVVVQQQMVVVFSHVMLVVAALHRINPKSEAFGNCRYFGKRSGKAWKGFVLSS